MVDEEQQYEYDENGLPVEPEPRSLELPYAVAESEMLPGSCWLTTGDMFYLV